MLSEQHKASNNSIKLCAIYAFVVATDISIPASVYIIYLASRAIDDLYTLRGEFINLEYLLHNNIKTKLLSDNEAYLGNQVECEFSDENYKRCYGLVANMSFILVCEYGENGSDPEIIIYKKR